MSEIVWNGTTHELKVWPEFFSALWNLNKTFEVRKNDRDFHIGDRLLLMEWDNAAQLHTGRYVRFLVTYILLGGQFGVEEGYCVMGMRYETAGRLH